jgi:hypothetical protein
MLTNTFIHIQAIGEKTEQRLWNSGFRDWDSLPGDPPNPIPAGRKFLRKVGIFYAQKVFVQSQETRLPAQVGNL